MAGYYTQTPAFDSAASYLSTSASGVSNATKLEIYGLFKYVTTAVKPTSSRPGLLDFTGRAKWDAWAGMEKKYGLTGQGDAERRYLDIAKELGWDEASASAAPPAKATKAATQTTEEEEITFDSDEEELSRPRTRPEGDANSAGGSLGVSVSAMARPAEARDGGVFGAAVKGDVEHLRALLQQKTGLDINQPDQYGYTPLHLACDRGHIEVVKLLLENGADRSIKDPDEFTPLELAEVARRSDIVALLSSSN